MAMNKIKVLIVDDSVVMRRILREAISGEPGFEVAGVAANGRIALAMLEQVTPDAVTLDIDMPELDGLETLRILRSLYAKLPVVMFSVLSERGAAATLEALTLGADDYVTKPSNVSDLADGIKRIRSQLLPKLKALCDPSEEPSKLRRAIEEPPSLSQKSNVSPPNPSVARSSPSSQPPGGTARVDVIAIGTSTGGPNALAEVIPRLPRDLPVPVLIVQHMPPTFTRFLAERLAATSAIPVVEAIEGDRLEPGKVWIAPGDFHMTVRRDLTMIRIAINQLERENSCRPSVDVLFRSVAQVYGVHALAVVMTGMGQDGLRGCECIKQAGGQILIQDEASSVVWGMPGFVSKAGLADRTMPLAEIGAELSRRACVGNPFCGSVADAK
jgi:two-component system, chemotaxis family, protein-glutamate methylesterase/glutaminase